MNIAALLTAAAGRTPDRPAWIYADRRATYAQTSHRVALLAGGLRARFAAGDRVVLVLPNGPDLLELLWATMWAGLVVVPVNRHLHPREVAYIVAQSGASAIIVAERTASAAREVDPAAVVVLRTDSQAYEQFAEAEPIGAVTVDPADPAWLFYTSGTTGKPKGATLSHRNLTNMALNYYAEIDQVTDGSIYLHAAPLTHASGLYMVPLVGRGATNVISHAPRFDPLDYLRLAVTHDVTHGAFLAPTMLRRLTDAAAEFPGPLPPLRGLPVGGSALYEQDLRDAVEVFGPVITQVYGQGEAPMTISVMTPRDLSANESNPAAWRSCGRPFLGVQVAFAHGPGVPSLTDTAGEICVRGDVVMTGYWADPAATAEALTDGWLHTGDVGHLDDLGYLYLTDRSKDVIITGGSNVYPREIEEVLLTHPQVREVAVIGIPDPEWGESICAHVLLAEGSDSTAAELIDYCADHLASFKKPKKVVFTDELPKSANGKILKRSLREQAVST